MNPTNTISTLNTTNLTSPAATASVQLPTSKPLPCSSNQPMQPQIAANTQSTTETQSTTKTQDWNISIPPREVRESPQQILLLTIAGITVHGYWLGECGQHYSGWAVIPDNYYIKGAS